MKLGQMLLYQRGLAKLFGTQKAPYSGRSFCLALALQASEEFSQSVELVKERTCMPSTARWLVRANRKHKDTSDAGVAPTIYVAVRGESVSSRRGGFSPTQHGPNNEPQVAFATLLNVSRPTIYNWTHPRIRT
jgi:hypothetical protein